jgi:hypothetical protein
MVDRAIDDKSSNTLVVVSGEGFWTGSSTLPHLHHFFAHSAVRERALLPTMALPPEATTADPQTYSGMMGP